jgi:hypothetical protein
MAKVELRNTGFHGWFAGRAHRAAPEPEMIEEHFFINMVFAHGKLRSGGPLRRWSKSIGPGLPANLDIELRPDTPVFPTRPRQEPSMAPRDEHRPARKYAHEKEEVQSAESAAEAFRSGDADAEDKGTLGTLQEKRASQLPEKKPQYKLSSRSAYSSRKRRPARFAR